MINIKRQSLPGFDAEPDIADTDDYCLLVEGASDSIIINELVKALPDFQEGIDRTLKIIAVSGKLSTFKIDVPEAENTENKQLALLNTLMIGFRKNPALRLGIILDADKSRENTFHSLVGKLSQLKRFPQVALPKAPFGGTTSLSKDLCNPSNDRCSVFITPFGNRKTGQPGLQRNGTLEHYLLEAIQHGDLTGVNTASVIEFAKSALGVKDLSLNIKADLFTDLGTHSAKWLAVASLMTLAKKTHDGELLNDNDLLKKGCKHTTDFGYAVESSKGKPLITNLNDWPNLQALGDYLTAFLQ
jgi:hypothetical protein